MCYGCWKKAGCPAIITPKTIEAAMLIDKVYEYEEVGGGAHIVIDDWNLDTDSIIWSRSHLDWNEYSNESLDAQKKCLEALLGMNTEERFSAMAIHDGYIKQE